MAFRLGMLGMWHAHAPGLVRQIALHPDEFQLVSGWDVDENVTTQRQNEWLPLCQGFHTVGMPEDVLQSGIDGVIVEGRVFENLSLAQLAIDAGLPVLLEKPAGVDLPSFERLIDSARKKSLHIQMLYLFRYMSAVEEMFRLARNGALGSIFQFRARLPKPLTEYEKFQDQLKPYRGGIFFEMAGHVIDMMAAMLGEPTRATSYLGHHHPHISDPYIDHGLAVFEFENAWATIEVSALESATGCRRIEVFGTDGACIIPHLGTGHLENDPVQPIEVFDGHTGKWKRHNLSAATLQIRDLCEFAAVVRGQKPADFSLDHDLCVQRALLTSSGML